MLRLRVDLHGVSIQQNCFKAMVNKRYVHNEKCSTHNIITHNLLNLIANIGSPLTNPDELYNCYGRNNDQPVNICVHFHQRYKRKCCCHGNQLQGMSHLQKNNIFNFLHK